MTARHGGVRAFGKRYEGSRANAFQADLGQVRAFGVRAHFVVKTVLPVEAAPSSGSAANLVAAVGVAAVLMASAPADAEAAGSAPSASEPVISETMPAVEPTEVAIPDAIAESSIEARDLYLEVFINDVSTGLIASFRETEDGGLSCPQDQLGNVGINPVASAMDPDGWVRVDQLPGVEYRIDEGAQQIHITTGLEGRSTREINLGAPVSEDRLVPTASWGGVLNYSLFASTNSLTGEEEADIFQGASGSFDARIFGPYGTLNQSFTAGYSDDELDDVVRLNTTWAYSDVNRMLTYRAGDFSSGGLTWTRPVYLGGFQVQRNFSLRSDLVTMPLPSFKGTAAVPSTLEVYTQNTQTYSQPVGEGPFELSNLPIYSGGGEARVVLRDSLGRETEATLPFYASNKLLAKGLIDFSVEAGAPRRNFGTESFDYDERVYGVASARYGLTNWLTLEAHAEVGEDLINGGAGTVFPLAHFGVASVAAAGSQHGDEIGAIINASVELEYDDWTFFGRVQRTFGDYNDVASVTADIERHPSLTDAVVFSAAVPKAVEQIAVSVPLPLDFSNLSLSYTHVEATDGKESQVVGASYNQQVFNNVSLYASAFVDLEDKDSFGIYAGLSMPLGADYSAATGVDSSGGGTRVTASVSKAEKLENGNFSWRAQTSEGKSPYRSASATYRSPWARFEAGVQQVDKDFRATAQVDGAIAVAGGGIFAANRIDDAFAVVDVGVPDVQVLQENRKYGKTNRSGRILVTGLNSYQKNQIAIDPASLPVDASIPATKEIVVPAGQSGVKVDFGVKTDVKAALVNLVDASGTPLEVGLTGRLEGSDQEVVIGYDGQAYVEGLGGSNLLLIDMGDGRECRAQFKYQAKKGEQSVIDGVSCL